DGRRLPLLRPFHPGGLRGRRTLAEEAGELDQQGGPAAGAARPVQLAEHFVAREMLVVEIGVEPFLQAPGAGFERAGVFARLQEIEGRERTDDLADLRMDRRVIGAREAEREARFFAP